MGTLSYVQMRIRKVTRRYPSSEARHPVRKFFFYLLLLSMMVSVLLIWYIYDESEKIISSRLEGPTWSLPSTIFADAPMVYEGMLFPLEDVAAYLNRLDYQKISSSDVRSGQYSVSKDMIAFQKRALYVDKDDTFPVSIKFQGSRIIKILRRDTKEEIPAVELEPLPITSLFGTDWEKRTLVHFDDIPDHVIQAVLAIEDRRFFTHPGLDLRAILRAVWSDVILRKPLQGGSTITQQLVKNFYLTPERTIHRKVNEAVMAWIIEKKLSKNQILELYLNEVYLGQRGSMSINGFGEASRHYFRTDLQHITVSQAALLAGMIQAPNSYNPYRHPERATDRRNIVLKAMVDTGALTESDMEKYADSELEVRPFDSRVSQAPYFGSLVKAQLLEKYDAEAIYSQNLNIFTTLDLDLQQAGEEALSAGLKKIDEVRFARVKKSVEGCLIAIEPHTGYIRAFVGGRSYSKSQFDRITSALRQPGSIFKPVVYAAALEKSLRNSDREFTPATLVADEPWVLTYANKTWAPKNYDGQYHGVVSLRMALAQSMNIATARVAQEVGLEEVAQLGKKLGFETVKPYPSLALGAFEVTPWQVASAYTVFSNGGVKTELRSISKVTDAMDKTLEHSQIGVQRVLRPETAYVVTDMLRSVLTDGTGVSVRQRGFTRPAAGKTGTTDEYRDAWFVGYTPQMLCVVWTGYDDNTPLRMTGAQAALPIWTAFMKKAMNHLPVEDFSAPNGVVAVRIDPTSGLLATPGCQNTVMEVFISGTEPVESCTTHQSHWWQKFG